MLVADPAAELGDGKAGNVAPADANALPVLRGNDLESSRS